MRTLLLLSVFSFGILTARAGPNVPYPDITPTRKPEQHNIVTPAEKGTPRAQPHQQGLYISLDFMMWQMRMDGLEYSYTEFDDTELIPQLGGVQYTSNRWRPGFKVGVGTFLPLDSWRLEALYSWYQNNEASNITSQMLYPLWDIANNFDDYNITKGLVTSAGASLQFEYNTIDVSLARNIFLSDFLRTEPFIGMKAAWMTQDYTVNYAHQFSSLFAEELTMKNNQNYYAVGMRAGANFQWSFDKMLSLVANGAYSLLWSHYKTTRQDSSTLIPTELSTELVNLDTQAAYFTNTACYEFELGFKMEWWLYKDVYHFEMLGMWETQYWPNQNQLITLSPDQILGDLSLTGFTFRARLDF